MLDQSFSSDNFRTIMQAQNRKGIYVEEKKKFDDDTFLLSRRESEKILILNQKIKDERERLKVFATASGTPFDYKSYIKFKEDVEEEKNVITEQRELLLEDILTSISNDVNKDKFKIVVKKGDVKWGKQLYVAENNAANYFVLKQTQYNIKKSFDAKQASRSLIVGQLVTLFNDNFPKVIVRTDITEFYESIPHKLLINRVNDNNILNYPSKRIVKDILNTYWKILTADGLKSSVDERKGVPRGVGISAYLSELYLKSFDNEIKSLPNVTYYSRYVDDIIIVFTPESRTETFSTTDYESLIDKLLLDKTTLNVNKSKTEIVDLRKKTSEIKVDTSQEITFLGYKFVFSYKFVTETKNGAPVTEMRRQPLEVLLSDARYGKYSDRIIKTFSTYNTDKGIYLKKANRLLIKRIKYLTGNTRLAGNKTNVFTGIYFSNQHLSLPLKDLIRLDKWLKYQVNIHFLTPCYLKTRVEKYSFFEGFTKGHFAPHSINELNQIVSIWK